MVMPEITIGFEGEKMASRRLQLAADVLGDLRPLFDDVVHPWFIDHMKRAFATEGAYTGAPWDKYTDEPKYKGYKEAVADDLHVLRWKGGNERLYPSLTNERNSDHVYWRSAREVHMGTAVPYAARLHHGGHEGPFGERYPARPIMRAKKSQLSGRGGLFKRIQGHLVDQIREARIVRSQP